MTVIAAVMVAFALTLAVKSGKLGIFGTVIQISRVSAVIEEAEEAIEAGDAGRFVALFADDFNWQGVTYSRLKEAGPGLLRSLLPAEISIKKKKIEVDRLRARATIDAASTHRIQSDLEVRSQSRWRVDFVNREGEWKIDRVTNISIDNHEGYRLDALMRHLGESY